jgi:hypothetical protein
MKSRQELKENWNCSRKNSKKKALRNSRGWMNLMMMVSLKKREVLPEATPEESIEKEVSVKKVDSKERWEWMIARKMMIRERNNNLEKFKTMRMMMVTVIFDLTLFIL